MVGTSRANEEKALHELEGRATGGSGGTGNNGNSDATGANASSTTSNSKQGQDKTTKALAEAAEITQGISILQTAIRADSWKDYVRGLGSIPARGAKAVNLSNLVDSRKIWNLAQGGSKCINAVTLRPTGAVYGSMVRNAAIRHVYPISVHAFFYVYAPEVQAVLLDCVGWGFDLMTLRNALALSAYKSIRTPDSVHANDVRHLQGLGCVRISPTGDAEFFLPSSYPDTMINSLPVCIIQGSYYLPYTLTGPTALDGVDGMFERITEIPNCIRGELDVTKAVLLSHLYSLLSIILADIDIPWPNVVPKRPIVPGNLVIAGPNDDGDMDDVDGPPMRRRRIIEGLLQG